jgi:phosphoribosyl 1,2-cyclic phosphodiesterase
MKFCILASGSEGNCGLVEDAQGQAVLVDAGLSMRRTSERLTELGCDIGNVHGLLISHEHSDHLRGAAVMARRLDLPIYSSEGTLSLIKRYLPDTTQLHPMNGERHQFGGLEVEMFRVSHDAPETVGFSITEGDRRLVIATDLGTVDLLTLDWLRDSDAVVLEANHDLDMLLGGPYPWDLKQRIKSQKGHLSNQQAAEALVQIATPRLKRVVLAHVSRENNTPELALDKVRTELHNAGHSHIDVIVADQHSASERFEV